jgi:hypothetical protein
MKLVLASVSAALILTVCLAGCGNGDDVSGKELACKDEIVRQMEDVSQETEDVPPECEGISEDRLFELIQIADQETAQPG